MNDEGGNGMGSLTWKHVAVGLATLILGGIGDRWIVGTGLTMDQVDDRIKLQAVTKEKFADQIQKDTPYLKDRELIMRSIARDERKNESQDQKLEVLSNNLIEIKTGQKEILRRLENIK